MADAGDAGRHVLRATDATVRSDEVTLLPPTSLVVTPGEVCGVTGPNGSGKSTLLRVFLGRQDLTSGSCSLQGRDPDLGDPEQRRETASLVDPIPVARDLTLREQITLVAASWFGNSPESARRTATIIDELGLAGLTDRFPHQVSAGQNQLFLLALTLVRPAEVVLLDEPERHLDQGRVDLVGDLMAARARAGTTFLMATHDPALTRVCTSRVDLS